jgi:hypothetical protein
MYSYRLWGCGTFAVGCLLCPLGGLPLGASCDAPHTCNSSAVTLVVSHGVLALSLSLIAVGFMLAIPVIQVVHCNATDSRIMGLAQGVAQSASSLLRYVVSLCVSLCASLPRRRCLCMK